MLDINNNYKYPTSFSQPLDQKFQHSVSMLAWGYNEEELIQNFLDKSFYLLEHSVEDFELVFVDDGSTDQTPDIVRDYASHEPRLRIITNPTNMNIGPSARKALAAASKEYLFWQTVDWSYDLTHLRIFLELLKYFDIVTGVRPTPERLLSHIPVVRSLYRVRQRSDTLKSAIVSLSNYYIVRTLYGLNFHDIQCVGFYPTQLVHSMDLQGESSFLGPEMMAKSLAKGMRFIEVPIPFLPRSAGEAKGIKPVAIYRSVKDVFQYWLAWGWRVRRQINHNSDRRIFRVNEPMFLDEEVIHLTAPLFKYYQ